MERMKQIERLRKVSENTNRILLCLIFLLVAWVGLQTFSPSFWPRAAAQMQTGASSDSGAANKPPQPLTPEQKVELQNQVEQAKTALKSDIATRDGEERALLDRLITLTGLYSAILGLTAYFTLRLAREDAKDQIERTKTDLATFQTTTAFSVDNYIKRTQSQLDTFQATADKRLDSFVEAARIELASFQSTAKEQSAGYQAQSQKWMEELQKKIKNELPEIANLKDNLEFLLAELERDIPSESDWNDERSYEKLSPRRRQKIQINESTIGALQIFISPEAMNYNESMSRLYRALARFYFGRCSSEGQIADGERADAYASRAIELTPTYAGAYRLRGAIALAMHPIVLRSQTNPLPARNPAAARLLDSAESDLESALARDKNDLGAYYNLALVYNMRGDVERARQLSMDTIARLKDFPTPHVRKFASSLYGNAACYLALQADRSDAVILRNRLRAQAIEVLEEGAIFLKGLSYPPSVEALGRSIEREKSGDFKNFDDNQEKRLELVLMSLKP